MTVLSVSVVLALLSVAAGVALVLAGVRHRPRGTCWLTWVGLAVELVGVAIAARAVT